MTEHRARRSRASRTLAATSAAALVAVVATTAVAEAEPSRLWYRIGLSVSETRERTTASGTQTIRSRWDVASDGAVVLSKRRPAAARDDLAFRARVSGTWEPYDMTLVNERGGFVQCTGRTRPRIVGRLATDSLGRAGVGLRLESVVQTQGDHSGFTCVHTLAGLPFRTDVLPAFSGSLPFTWPPVSRPQDLRQIRVRGVGARFGKSFRISRTIKSPRRSDGTRKTTLRLSFKVCPRGARAVHRC
jgi:hypothetical protein